MPLAAVAYGVWVRGRIARDDKELPMLVTFRAKAYANITMFGDVAKQLL